ncbi:MAG TPA: AAA family ATPase, partial [Candidatus Limnocylindrales bacterium]|nr:AAA family ATPase [Candidatus Limnocylindrales bacterium]
MAFIGRERELSALGAALMRAAEGEPSRIAVSGPLGIGISRLIDELGERLGGFAGVTLLRSRHHAPTSGVPYGALARALDDVLSTVPDDRLPQLIGSSAHDAISLLPDAAARVTALGLAVEAPPLDALEQRGARVRESLFGVIGRLATSGPLVLVVEDLEHSDPGTRELLSVLVRIRRRLPLALIVGYHTDQLPRHHPALRFVREIEESAAVEKLEMQPFVAEEMAAFVEAIQGERPTLGFVAAVMEGSRGNPLIAEQLVAAEAELAALRLSDPFEEILQARVEQLEPVGMRALRVLAAARRPLSAAELGAIQLRDGHLPRNVVSQVVESTLVRELESGIAIVHELCAEAIEASMLPTERHEVHAALATLVADRPAEAAWHWTQAGRAADAFASHLRAAREATNTESGSTAFFHYAAALELADGERPDDVEILTAAAEAAAAAGAFRRAATYIDQAIRRVAGGRVERLLDGRSARA